MGIFDKDGRLKLPRGQTANERAKAGIAPLSKSQVSAVDVTIRFTARDMRSLMAGRGEKLSELQSAGYLSDFARDLAGRSKKAGRQVLQNLMESMGGLRKRQRGIVRDVSVLSGNGVLTVLPEEASAYVPISTVDGLTDRERELAAALRLCIVNAETAAEYAGRKGGPADTLTLKNAPNWPGIVKARDLLKGRW